MAKQAKKVELVAGSTSPCRTQGTYELGEVISVAFEQALAVTDDSHKAAELTSVVVQRLLQREAQRRCIAQLAAL
jgi:hypothetical protein